MKKEITTVGVYQAGNLSTQFGTVVVRADALQVLECSDRQLQTLRQAFPNQVYTVDSVAPDTFTNFERDVFKACVRGRENRPAIYSIH